MVTESPIGSQKDQITMPYNMEASFNKIPPNLKQFFLNNNSN